MKIILYMKREKPRSRIAKANILLASFGIFQMASYAWIAGTGPYTDIISNRKNSNLFSMRHLTSISYPDSAIYNQELLIVEYQGRPL